MIIIQEFQTTTLLYIHVINFLQFPRLCSDSPSVLSIRAGSTFVNSGGVIVPVAVIYEHPQFDYFDIDFDITLLLLTSPLTFSASIQPIDLPYLNQPVPGGTLTTVTGWGSLSEGGPSPSQLQEVQVPIVSNDVCQQAYYMYPITDRMLCAGLLGEGGRDACQVRRSNLKYVTIFSYLVIANFVSLNVM